ncbi:MAG TPA: DUF4292 domain-containing protein, partial [Candidatus Angelobacter sp.]|nr:DUF4292 domain-containing protein [Candidatus Angelobacter sp.]
TRVVESKTSTAVLREATLQQLVDIINASATRLQTLNAAVDIDSAVGGQKKGQITENPEITGSLLLGKPDLLRLIGYVPVIRNRAFDMVSNGKDFRLSVPSKSLFVIGSDQVITPAREPIYNIRPQHILDALLLKEIDLQNDIAILENGIETVKDPKTHKDVDQDDYVVIVISKDDHGPYLSRKIVFSRVNLQPDRQLIYDRQAHLVTDARYANFKDYNGMEFPSRIELERPVEEYAISLTITKMTLNEKLEDDQFKLPQPPGYQLINLDDKATAERLAAPKVSDKEKKQKPKQEDKKQRPPEQE